MSLRSIILAKGIRDAETQRRVGERMEHGVKEWQRNGRRGETQKYENEEEIGRQITIDCMAALLCKV